MCAIAKDGSQTLSFLQHDDSSLLVLFAGAYGGCSPCQVVEAEAPITTHARYRANGGGFRRQLIIAESQARVACLPACQPAHPRFYHPPPTTTTSLAHLSQSSSLLHGHSLQSFPSVVCHHVVLHRHPPPQADAGRACRELSRLLLKL